ncbi:MAG: hypothetical protein H0W62_06805 [Chitinophagales bacterium]|nr:hypothetical protein [Chitinophagales bacterium]
MNTITSSNFLKHEAEINPAFDKENLRKEQQSTVSSLLITAALHAMLLLIFYFFFGLKPPFPPLSEQGVYLNIGLLDEGIGNVQPEGNAAQLNIPSHTESKTQSQKKSNDVLTEETKEDVPVIAKKEEVHKSVAPVKSTSSKNPNQTVEAPQQPKAKALYPGNKPNNSTSEGTGSKMGDQGKPNGNVNGTDYSGNPGLGNGGPGGNGIAQLGMSGRKIIIFPTIIDNSQKTGRVVVNIKVDRDGSVIFAKATQKGSTTTDSYLYQLAEDAAMKTKVNSDANAAEEQFGTITFTFRVK